MIDFTLPFVQRLDGCMTSDRPCVQAGGDVESII
jgi:hypothetical protein